MRYQSANPRTWFFGKTNSSNYNNPRYPVPALDVETG